MADALDDDGQVQEDTEADGGDSAKAARRKDTGPKPGASKLSKDDRKKLRGGTDNGRKAEKARR
jgi:hypothetical protein